jgi:hypothetical protein
MIRLPVGGYLAEMDALSHRDVAHFRAVGQLRDGRRWQRYANAVHPCGADFVSPNVLCLARRLGVQETQVSCDERNEYFGITLERAGKILDSLYVRLRT